MMGDAVDPDHYEPSALEDSTSTGSGHAGESPRWSYHWRSRRGAGTTFRGAVIVVSGDEGDRLRAELAAATAALLSWATTLPDPGMETDQGGGVGGPTDPKETTSR